MAGSNLNFSLNNPQPYEEGDLYDLSRRYNYGYNVDDEILRNRDNYSNSRLALSQSLYSQRNTHYSSAKAEGKILTLSNLPMYMMNIYFQKLVLRNILHLEYLSSV